MRMKNDFAETNAHVNTGPEVSRVARKKSQIHWQTQIDPVKHRHPHLDKCSKRKSWMSSMKLFSFKLFNPQSEEDEGEITRWKVACEMRLLLLDCLSYSILNLSYSHLVNCGLENSMAKNVHDAVRLE